MAVFAQEVGDHLHHGQLIIHEKHFGHIICFSWRGRPGVAWPAMSVAAF
jgi:hypothetical protein